MWSTYTHPFLVKIWTARSWKLSKMTSRLITTRQIKFQIWKLTKSQLHHHFDFPLSLLKCNFWQNTHIKPLVFCVKRVYIPCLLFALTYHSITPVFFMIFPHWCNLRVAGIYLRGKWLIQVMSPMWPRKEPCNLIEVMQNRSSYEVWVIWHLQKCLTLLDLF